MALARFRGIFSANIFLANSQYKFRTDFSALNGHCFSTGSIFGLNLHLQLVSASLVR